MININNIDTNITNNINNNNVKCKGCVCRKSYSQSSKYILVFLLLYIQ